MKRAFATISMIAAALTATLAPAQQPPPAAPGEASKTRVEGRVLTTGGDPVPRATLRMRSNAIIPGADRAGLIAGYMATSDAEGNFVLEGLPPSEYTFTAEKTGFVNQAYQAKTPGTNGAPIRLAAGQTIKGVEFRLSANAIVSGTVTDRNGDPIAGKQVSLLYRNWTRGARDWFSRNNANTDDRGEFRIAGVAPGQYILSVGENAFEAPAPQPTSFKEALVTTYFPGTADMAAATPLRLTPGMEMTGLKLVMRPEPVFTLRVAAVDQTNNLVPGAALAIRSRTQTSTSVTSSALNPTRSTDGYFVFRNLPAGEYIIQARPRPQALVPESGADIAQLYGRLEIRVTDKDIDDAVIRLAPNIPSMDVRITVEDAEAAAAAAKLRAGNPTLGMLEPEIPGFNNRAFRLLPGGQPPSGLPGTWFRAESVARAVYGVNLSPLPDGMYVKSVRFGGQDVTSEPLDLTNSPGGPIDIVVSAKAADISGVVRNDKGEPVGAVAIALWPKAPNRSNLQGGSAVAISDGSGAFRLANLAPGEYYLAGWEETRTGQAENTAFRALFTTEAIEIDLDEGVHIVQELKPIPLAETERRTTTLP